MKNRTLQKKICISSTKSQFNCSFLKKINKNLDQKIILEVLEIIHILVHSSPIECSRSFQDRDISQMIELGCNYSENSALSYSILKIFNNILPHLRNHREKIIFLINEVFSFWLAGNFKKYLRHEIFENYLSLENAKSFVQYCFRSNSPYWILKGAKLLLNFMQNFDSSNTSDLINGEFCPGKTVLDVIFEHLIASNRSSTITMVSLW